MDHLRQLLKLVVVFSLCMVPACSGQKTASGPVSVRRIAPPADQGAIIECAPHTLVKFQYEVVNRTSVAIDHVRLSAQCDCAFKDGFPTRLEPGVPAVVTIPVVSAAAGATTETVSVVAGGHEALAEMISTVNVPIVPPQFVDVPDEMMMRGISGATFAVVFALGAVEDRQSHAWLTRAVADLSGKVLPVSVEFSEDASSPSDVCLRTYSLSLPVTNLPAGLYNGRVDLFSDSGLILTRPMKAVIRPALSLVPDHIDLQAKSQDAEKGQFVAVVDRLGIGPLQLAEYDSRLLQVSESRPSPETAGWTVALQAGVIEQMLTDVVFEDRTGTRHVLNVAIHIE